MWCNASGFKRTKLSFCMIRVVHSISSWIMLDLHGRRQYKESHLTRGWVEGATVHGAWKWNEDGKLYKHSVNQSKWMTCGLDCRLERTLPADRLYHLLLQFFGCGNPGAGLTVHRRFGKAIGHRYGTQQTSTVEVLRPRLRCMIGFRIDPTFPCTYQVWYRVI